MKNEVKNFYFSIKIHGSGSFFGDREILNCWLNLGLRTFGTLRAFGKYIYKRLFLFRTNFEQIINTYQMPLININNLWLSSKYLICSRMMLNF